LEELGKAMSNLHVMSSIATSPNTISGSDVFTMDQILNRDQPGELGQRAESQSSKGDRRRSARPVEFKRKGKDPITTLGMKRETWNMPYQL